jgi:hypothetical protein
MSAFIEIIDNITNGLRKWFQRFKGGERVSLLSWTTNALIEKIFPTEHREEVANILKRFRFEHSGNGITTMPKPAANICQGHFGVRAP